MPPSRRALLGGLAALATTPLLAACGDDTKAPASGGSASSGGAFPVTIDHKFGTTTIESAPKKVVCVGLVEQDALLALGVVPVAVTYWFGDAPGQVFPWAQDYLKGAEPPKVLKDTNGVEVEKIAALAPDLIIGQYAGLKKKDYDLLSAIAPTVAQPKGYVDYGVPWDESTLTIAKAIGKPDEGKALVDKVNARLDKEAADHPEFKGQKAVCVTAYEGLFVYGPEDPRGRILSQLGFEFPQQLDDPSSKEFGWSLSAERTSDLDEVKAVVWLGTEQEVDTGTGGLWAKTTAAKEGRGFFIGEPAGAYYIAQSMVTPLSIPYVLDRYVPQLAAAVDGDPATKVPESAA